MRQTDLCMFFVGRNFVSAAYARIQKTKNLKKFPKPRLLPALQLTISLDCCVCLLDLLSTLYAIFLFDFTLLSILSAK